MDQFPAVYEPWGLQEEIKMLKLAQFEQAERLNQHSERIGKLEKRQDDSRIRSLWSSTSPFPAPLSTFSQQPSLNADPGSFDGFDHHQNLVLSGLQLDEVDIPRRGASRANSVRFDDSATTNHWIRDSPGTSDYFGQRPGSASVGGYAMTERSSSHKSDGRQSIRSLGADFSSYEGDNAAFRPPTRSSDILDSCLHRPTGPKVGPAPAMVRCWIGNPCSYEPLLFAVICTGAARSAIEMSLVIQQRFQDRIVRISETESTIELPVYLPDATVQQHSRISGPSKIARLTVDFVIMPVGTSKSRDDKIRIFIGSDVIASHMGDVLFSQSKIFLHVDDGRKVFIPFIRPDAEEAFADIYTAHGSHYTPPTIGSPPSDPVNPVKPPGLDPNPLSQLSVSSPRPIHGPQACVLRGVASMEPHDFVPNAKEHHTVASGTYPPDPTRPWTSTSVAHSDNFDNDSFGPFSPGPPEDISHPSAEAGEAVTRGRSMTNPFEDIPITVQKPKSWGEGARKSSMSYSAPLKESNGGGGGGGGSYSRGSSRGMKVLRTSKSFSSSSEKAPEGQTAKHASFAKAGNSQRGHGRTMSGGDAIAKVGTGGSVLVRTKSSNVVGGATAFHWMATAGGG